MSGSWARLTLALLLLLAGCAHQSGRSSSAGEAKIGAAARPWPEPLQDTWHGVLVRQEYLLDSLQREFTDSVELRLDTGTFEYHANSRLMGKGTYSVDGPYLIFNYLFMERIVPSESNVMGRFEFVYQDSVLILYQYEAVGPPVRNQVFLEKELTLKRNRK